MVFSSYVEPLDGGVARSLDPARMAVAAEGETIICGRSEEPEKNKTMDSTRQEAIASRAHQLWEQGGRVHGQHDEHWDQAEREVDAAAGADQGEAETASTTSETVAPEVATPTHRRGDKG